MVPRFSKISTIAKTVRPTGGLGGPTDSSPDQRAGKAYFHFGPSAKPARSTGGYCQPARWKGGEEHFFNIFLRNLFEYVF